MLAVEGLDVDLGRRPVLRGIDLHVGGGELVGLLGPNGAGKTTLIRSILGLIRPRSGRVLFDGRPVRAGSAFVGYVPQRHEFAWDFPISVEHVVLTGRIRRMGAFRRAGVEDWIAVSDALERVGLSELRERPVGELSGGQRQRVLVARALALAPALLLLDEPFTGLDLPAQDHLTTLFVGLAEEGHAVLMSTHDLLGARASCSRLVLLNRRVVATGTPSQLRDELVWSETFGVGTDNPLIAALTAG